MDKTAKEVIKLPIFQITNQVQTMAKRNIEKPFENNSLFGQNGLTYDKKVFTFEYIVPHLRTYV